MGRLHGHEGHHEVREVVVVSLACVDPLVRKGHKGKSRVQETKEVPNGLSGLHAGYAVYVLDNENHVLRYLPALHVCDELPKAGL